MINISYHSNGVSNGDFSNDRIVGKIIVVPKSKEFIDWLKGQVSNVTLNDYINYLKKFPNEITPSTVKSLIKNRWFYRVFMKIINYLWAKGELSVEERERWKVLAKVKVSEAKVIKSKVISVNDVIKAVEVLKERKPDYLIPYLIMIYSGARLGEATYLISNISKYRVEVPQKTLGVIGFVNLGNYVRVNVHYSRGSKRCEHLWLPKQLFNSIKEIKLNPKKISNYTKNIGIIPSKYLRKFHYQVLEDVIDDVSLRNFIQNRYTHLTIGDVNYSKLVVRADQTYQKIMEKINQITKQTLLKLINNVTK